MDYFTDKSDIITTTKTTEATTEATTEFTATSTSTSTTTSTPTTDLVTDEGTTQLSTITTEFVMPTFGDSENSDFSTEKSPETKSEFITEAPKIPATWTDWVSFNFRRIKSLVVQLKKNDCDMCGCDCQKSKKFVLMRTCELDDIPVDSSYCIGDETKFLDIDCTAQCSLSGIR